MFIGKKGNNIDDLTKYFINKAGYKDFKIYMFEQNDLTDEILSSLDDYKTYDEDYWYTENHKNNDMDNLENHYE